MKKTILSAVAGISACFIPTSAFAHCEVPCGIYGDEGRFTTLQEHIKTIEKAMVKINSGQENQNQTVRWVLNKEKHAEEIQSVIARYFLAQRVKAGKENYLKSLELCHQIIVFAMKSKQTTDLKNVSKLRELVSTYEKLYFNRQATHSHNGHDHKH